jgi:hypothetical protein
MLKQEEFPSLLNGTKNLKADSHQTFVADTKQDL